MSARPKEWPPVWHDDSTHTGGSDHPCEKYRIEIPHFGPMWIFSHGKSCPKHEVCGWWMSSLRLQVFDVKLKAKSAKGAKKEALYHLRHLFSVAVQGLDQRLNGDKFEALERTAARRKRS